MNYTIYTAILTTLQSATTHLCWQDITASGDRLAIAILLNAAAQIDVERQECD
jgi:hypothetical protein